LKTSGLSFEARRKFWQHFTGHALTRPDQEPQQDDYAALLARTRDEGAAASAGSVTLVGAGPGDPELLTLRAVRALQSADIILIDDLVSSEVLDFARREARKMLVGKTGYGPSCKQEEINTLMVGLAKSGQRVVRLKGGDPGIFGRAGEEVAACRAAGIPVEIVPGITAAQAAASRLSISLSHRDHARRIQYITGHSKQGQLPGDLDWHSLADPHVTTAIYMPVRTLAEFVTRATQAGLDPATPAAVVVNATRPNEQMVIETVATLPAAVVRLEIDGPAIVLVGRALSEADIATTNGLGTAETRHA
jgi:uroporphyrin-III C-methyltransferase/precorrin-2 dehydrogenase/sirohydrochlorin ferrochelatase